MEKPPKAEEISRKEEIAVQVNPPAVELEPYEIMSKRDSLFDYKETKQGDAQMQQMSTGDNKGEGYEETFIRDEAIKKRPFATKLWRNVHLSDDI